MEIKFAPCSYPLCSRAPVTHDPGSAPGAVNRLYISTVDASANVATRGEAAAVNNTILVLNQVIRVTGASLELSPTIKVRNIGAESATVVIKMIG